MLIKVMTNRNTERLISNVSDVDIHHGLYNFSSNEELHDVINKGAGQFNSPSGLALPTNHPECIITFDLPILKSMTSNGLDGYGGIDVKFIDFKKDNYWNRLAIQCYAYICNDDGKTISKVSVEK